jgi:hypothetical protein
VLEIRIAKSIFVMIVIALGFAVPVQLLVSFTSVMTSSSSQLFEYVYWEEDQGNEEEVYLKFISSDSQQQSRH